MPQHAEPDEGVTVAQLTPASDSNMREVDLDAAVTRRTVPRVWAMQFGALLTLMLVLSGLLFRGYQAAQPQPEPTSTAVPTSTPEYPFPLSAAVYSNVTYGTLIVNGKQLDANLPVIVTLRPGVNTITLFAPPFQPHTCTFDTSRNSAEGAQCGGGLESPALTIGGKKASATLGIPVTLADLPLAQRSDVEAVVAQAIHSIIFHTTVPAHQYIATGVDAKGHITSRLTSEQMQADATLVQQTGQAYQIDPTCIENICSPVTIGPYNPSTATGKTWTVATFVAPQWRFRTATNASVALVTTSLLSDSGQNEIAVALEYDAVRGWSATGAPTYYDRPSDNLSTTSNIECAAGTTVLTAYVGEPAGGVSMHPNGIEGCELQTLTGSGKPIATFIWRFGVLLAADAEAHARVPGIPIAPQAEIDAVTAGS